MAVTIAQVISGVSAIHFVKDPAYVAAENWDTDPAAAFEAETEVDAGYISGPVVMEYSSEQEKIDVEQDTFPIKHLLKAEGVTLKFNLAEATLINLQLGMVGAPAVASDVLSIGPVSANAATSAIHHFALRIVTTGNTASKPVRRIIVPKAYMTGNMGLSFTKSGIQMVPVEFSACRAQESDTPFGLIPAVWIVDAAA